MAAKAKRHDRAGAASVQWRRERPDLDPFPMELVGRLCEVAEIVLKERLAPLFAAHGLQRGEFDVLATLRRAGAPYALTPTAEPTDEPDATHTPEPDETKGPDETPGPGPTPTED